jgi:hypothetical protein
VFGPVGKKQARNDVNTGPLRIVIATTFAWLFAAKVDLGMALVVAASPST